MRTFFRDMVRGLLLLFAVIPLRLITGRGRPDYARIAELELDCGLREPMNVIEKLSGISCPVEPVEPAPPRRREPLVLGTDWSIEPLSYQNTEQQLRARRLATWEQAKYICDTAAMQNRGLTAGELGIYENCMRMLDELDRLLRDTITRQRHQDYMLDRESKAWRDEYAHPVTCPCPRCDWRHE